MTGHQLGWEQSALCVDHILMVTRTRDEPNWLPTASGEPKPNDNAVPRY